MKSCFSINYTQQMKTAIKLYIYSKQKKKYHNYDIDPYISFTKNKLKTEK